MANRFVGIPNIPTENTSPAQLASLNAMKQNLELLIGTRGESDSASQAVIKGQIKLRQLKEQSLKRVTATGGGFNIDGVQVASSDDHGKLVVDVQHLANDLAQLRLEVQTLLNQIRDL